MKEQLIKSEDYTSEILAKIELIKNRMTNSLVEFTDDDIKVFRHNDSVYILGNPLLGEEPIFDSLGNFEKMVPMWNLTIIFDEDFVETKRTENGLQITVKIPRLRVLRPELCERILVK